MPLSAFSSTEQAATGTDLHSGLSNLFLVLLAVFSCACCECAVFDELSLICRSFSAPTAATAKPSKHFADHHNTSHSTNRPFAQSEMLNG